jgi:RimK family alpha-L-glutamate ligase
MLCWSSRLAASPAPLRIAIATDTPGWHGERLQAALAARGAHASFVSLRECRLDLTRTAHGLVMPGFEQRLPDGVFVRQVPGGTLEQVVLRLDFLHALKELGVPVYNDGRAIERTVDKAMTSFLLKHARIPTPPTWVAESAAQARAIVQSETAAGHKVVIKPLFGSQGKGLRRIGALQELPAADEYAGVHYLQRFLPPAGEGYRDWRVFVIAGQAVAAMQRLGQDWINNVAVGARCEAAALDTELTELAEAACKAVAVDYGGVDIMRGRDGLPQAVEVNGIPAWRGLQSVCGFDIAERLVDDFLARKLLAPAPCSVA